ncbi:helix-turn-helix domain-containing protein [Cohnella thermotolerans]|uniref:helix-turn-helix domain-containing protein n=1 Tax=Cohnella thermotolerans TaxID=329858 RepID=UPI00040290E6|nr:helix-turn-helix domain-containing protein [Cohnella thermotolerans]
MYKVFLVDDEPLVLEGLRLLVDWKARGFEVCGEARDGEDAFAAILDCRPDLVVTDIRMPVMDGIELIRQARMRADCPAKFILLSGYGEFEYVQSVMRHEAADYLLKPIDTFEFDRVLAKLRIELERERAEEQDAALERKEAAAAALALLVRGEDDPELRRRASAMLGMEEDTDVCVVLAEKGNGNAGTAFVLEEEEAAGRVRLFDDGSGGIGAVIVGKPERFASVLSDLHSRLANQTGDDVWLFVSRWGQGPERLKALHREAAHLRDNRPFAGIEIAQGILMAPQCPSSALYRVPIPDPEAGARLFRLIEAGDADGMAAALDEALERMRANGAGPSVIRAFIADLTVEVNRRYGPFEQPGDLPGPRSVGSSQAAGVRELRARLCRYGRLAAERFDRRRSAVAEAIRIVQEQFRKPLKLQDVAAALGAQPAYLGQLFKKATGETFHQFVHTYRVESAKTLLRRTEMKIAEVARTVGYGDAEDFVRHFKERTGMTPSAYRNPPGRRGWPNR